MRLKGSCNSPRRRHLTVVYRHRRRVGVVLYGRAGRRGEEEKKGAVSISCLSGALFQQVSHDSFDLSNALHFRAFARELARARSQIIMYRAGQKSGP